MSAVVINIDTSLTDVPTIEVGKQGENGATQVVFDVSEMIETYGSGTAYVVVQRRGDAEPYLLDNTSQSGDTVTWTVSNVDTDVYGTGRVQLFWMINEQVAKTVTYQFYVEEALHDPQDAPVVPGGWISDEIGNLDNLTTTAKANLVAAINEVNSKATTNTTAIGTLANLTTTEKSNLVGAINEVDADVSDLKEDLEQTQTQLDETTALALAALPQETIENVAIASFDDGGDGVPVKELKIAIEPIQSGSGDPSPTNVRPISGRDSVTLTRTGVNVWDEEWESGDLNSVGEPTTDATRIRTKNYINVLPSTSYYIYCKNNEELYLYQYSESKEYISRQLIRNNSFTTGVNTHYLKFFVASKTTYNHDISINYPSTDHDYHAYEGDSYPIPLSSTIYGGTLEVETGVLTVNRAMVDLGTLSWDSAGAGKFYTTGLNTVIRKGTSTHGYNLIFASIYSAQNISSVGSLSNNCMSVDNSGNVQVHDDRFSSGADLKTALDGIMAVYEVATPTTVQLTPTQVTTLLKDNNIFADSGDVKKLIYRADLGTYIQNLINA